MTHVLAALLAMMLGTGVELKDRVLSGEYVEARTAEIYTGGCIMGSEGEVSGREALMAWRVDQGRFDGVPLNGLSVVALVAGDTNLGMHELGGTAPASIKTFVMVDERATPAQQQALVGMARSLAPRLIRDAVTAIAAPIDYASDGHTVRISAGAAKLDVVRHVEHSPVCGAQKWFEPLARVTDAEIGLTRRFQWSGTGLGARWTQIDRKSSYVGTFSLER